jgi:PAS domain S-box-containing protein
MGMRASEFRTSGESPGSAGASVAAEYAHPSAGHLENRLEFETLISELSTRFINLPPGEVDREIEDAMGRVCEVLGIDRAMLWQWSNEVPDLAVPTHSFPRQDSRQLLESMRQQDYPWARRELLAGRRVVVSSVEAMPPEYDVDRDTCRRLGIKSGLAFPLSVGGEPPVGVLGLNDLKAPRDWPDALVNRLELVAQVFANALARKRYELNLRETEARLGAAADLAGLAFYECNFDENLLYCDARLRDICGIPPDRSQGLSALEFWKEHLHPAERERLWSVGRQLHDGTLDRVSIEYRYLHPVRGETWIHHLAGARTRDATGRQVRTFGILRDVTQRKQSEDELRGLSRQLIRAHEEERALLARELHDDLTQRLAVLAIDVGRAELGRLDEAQAETMRAVREGLIRLSEDVHSLAYQLHPSVLDELGLAEALRTECERLGRQNVVSLSVRLDPLPEGIGKDAALCLFRVAQEALHNVVRHAQARTATVALEQADGGLRLAVRDDGIGFDTATWRTGRSLGLASMRERVRLVDGTLDIESAPGRGTTITVWVPAKESSP